LLLIILRLEAREEIYNTNLTKD